MTKMYLTHGWAFFRTERRDIANGLFNELTSLMGSFTCEWVVGGGIKFSVVDPQEDLVDDIATILRRYAYDLSSAEVYRDEVLGNMVYDLADLLAPTVDDDGTMTL